MNSTRKLEALPARIESLILNLRDAKVILDADLARIYEVSTKALNQAVKRNSDRFPPDFLIQLTKGEWKSLRSQIVTGSQKHRDPRALPYAFTEHGAIMAANILRSKRAIQMSVFVVRAFIRMRSMLTNNKELARRLAQLERELKMASIYTRLPSLAFFRESWILSTRRLCLSQRRDPSDSVLTKTNRSWRQPSTNSSSTLRTRRSHRRMIDDLSSVCCRHFVGLLCIGSDRAASRIHHL
jgi:hypothetical protein